MEIFDTYKIMYASFLQVIYYTTNGSAILESNKMHLKRNNMRLVRNKTRGGNLHLSGAVSDISNIRGKAIARTLRSSGNQNIVSR